MWNMRFLRTTIRPGARSITNLLAVFASLWGYTMTPGLWALFLGIGILGLVNLLIGISDERQLRADRRMLEDMRGYMHALVGPARIPPHLQDLTRLQNKQLKVLVSKVRDNLRAFAQAHETRAEPLWSSVPGWDSMSDDERRQEITRDRERTMSAYMQQNADFNRKARPDAVALWDELKRRLGSAGALPKTVVALEHGMLAGAYPVEDAATALETLARRLPD
jgi:hypothetical protein